MSTLQKLLSIGFVFYSFTSLAQEGRWDVYLAEWDEGPGSVVLNMALIENSPQEDKPFLVATGVKFAGCLEEGFPDEVTMDSLFVIQDSILNTIGKLSHAEHAGSFMYQCERLQYVYVTDTMGIRSDLESLYADHFKSFEPYINLKVDSEWKAYREFLYPNEFTLEYMSNQKVVDALYEAGDVINKERPISHWVYFDDEKQLDGFLKTAKKQGFKKVRSAHNPESAYPYELEISMDLGLDVYHLTEVTLSLRKLAQEFKGEYDGWESVVVSE